MLPIILGGVPFGLIAGVAASSIDLTPLAASGVSALIFAGAAQLATFDLIKDGAPPAVVILTAVLINLRFALYSATIAPIFRETSRPLRLLCAYLLTDQAFALSSAHNAKHKPSTKDQVIYYLGAASSLWCVWVTTTFIGASIGASLPPAWPLGFAVPLCFIAIVTPAIKDRTQLLCALITGGCSWALVGAPHKLGIIISILIGVGAGALLDRWSR